jgi:hypothetical protein
MSSCIYCSRDADSPEHWLPRSLGTFGSLQVLHKTVCGECNEAVGECDREFIRTGPEGIQRKALGIEGRGGEGGNPFYYRAATDQPVQAQATSDPEHADLYWEPRPGQEGQLLRQVVVESESGKRLAVPINLQWTPDVLRQALKSRNVEDWSLREVYCEPEDLEETRRLISPVFPRFEAQHYALSGAGQSNRTMRFMNAVGAGYMRGLAKIALHGALKLEPNLDGHAWEFDSLRRFIRHDERPRHNPVTALPPGSLEVDLGTLVLPKDRGHVLLIETRAQQVFVKLQFFLSASQPSDHVPPPWQVRLGRRPGETGAFSGLWLARYLAEPDSSGHVGEIIRIR